MDCDVAKYKKERFEEIRDEMRNMLQKVGYKKDKVANIPCLPISGWMGDNLVKQSENMGWWDGQECVDQEGNKHTLKTLVQTLNDFVCLPKREFEKPLRLPISGVYKIKGVGDVLAGRVEQGVVEIKKNVVFMPTHTSVNPCEGSVFTIEMHHKPVPKANPGDNVGMNIKGLKKENMPRSGDVMIYKDDKSLSAAANFTVVVQTLDIPGELKVGYSPIGFVRCGRSACKITKLAWKKGKETGGKKVEDPVSLKSSEMAEVIFEPQQQIVVDTFKNCDGLSRIAFLDGNTACMLGKVTAMTPKA